MTKNRAQEACRIRTEAAELAKARQHPTHVANPDEQRFAAANYPMSFTKGLQHDEETGLVADPAHFEAFRTAIDEGFVEPFTTRVPVPKVGKRRKWEAPTAGVVYDLEGPDAQAVTMPPAPELGSDELDFEMVEVYELAMLRDVPFNFFSSAADGGKNGDIKKIQAAINRMNALPYTKNGFRERNDGTPGRPRKVEQIKKAKEEDGEEECKCIVIRRITPQTAFRGSSPGVEKGPYLSQFLWIGTDDQAGGAGVDSGLITYGGQVIDQKVLTAKVDDDYMQTWKEWLKVQNGVDVNSCCPECPECSEIPGRPGQVFKSNSDKSVRRFIWTPRDLATYVHFDALYQAYLNATLILLGMNAPFDPAFAKLSGQGKIHDPLNKIHDPLNKASTCWNAGGFALYGGPHILTLVTEVATRALKAVRFQKFNNHLRLRPEALAGRLAKATEIDDQFPATCGAFTQMVENIKPTLGEINKFNGRKKNDLNPNHLLPMAFAEGSPMHPSYGAGHATVAGACTTIVKAFFDTSLVFGVVQDCKNKERIGFHREINSPVYFEPVQNGEKLERKDISQGECPLTLEGELNKLAANISIGRNMAGVHYFSDYYDSLRMGEEIAIGILEEQALCYPTDDFVLSVPTFDGELVRIGRR